MAKWRGKCAGHEVWINDVDHPPPHCHAIVEGRNKTVDLYTFGIRNPPPRCPSAAASAGAEGLASRSFEGLG
jgi:hypothetical protein